MALFAVRVAVLAFVEIPVHAESKDKALEYMKSTDEWKDDYGFSKFNHDSTALEAVSAEEVTDPKLTPRDFESDCYCWGYDDVTVAQAFYGSPPQPKSDEYEDPECDEYDLAWEAYFDAEKALVVKFNKERAIVDQSPGSAEPVKV